MCVYVYICICQCYSLNLSHPLLPLAWKIPWTEEPGRLQSMGSQNQTRLSNFTFTFSFPCCVQTSVLYFCVSIPALGEGNGSPLQYSCLENLMDGGTW